MRVDLVLFMANWHFKSLLNTLFIIVSLKTGELISTGPPLFLFCKTNIKSIQMQADIYYTIYLMKAALKAFSLEHVPHIMVVTLPNPAGAMLSRVR